MALLAALAAAASMVTAGAGHTAASASSSTESLSSSLKAASTTARDWVVSRVGSVADYIGMEPGAGHLAGHQTVW